MYRTDREANAELIVKILHEIPTEDRIVEDACTICEEFTSPGFAQIHSEDCPFRLADEFIAKYGTRPPEEAVR